MIKHVGSKFAIIFAPQYESLEQSFQRNPCSEFSFSLRSPFPLGLILGIYIASVQINDLKPMAVYENLRAKVQVKIPNLKNRTNLPSNLVLVSNSKTRSSEVDLLTKVFTGQDASIMIFL